MRLKPNDHEIYHVRGVIQQSLGQQQLAIQDFNRAIQIYPADGQYYLSRATAYRATGQAALAQSDEQRGAQMTGK